MTTIEGFAADQVISDESADQLKIPKYGNFFQPQERAKIEKIDGKAARMCEEEKMLMNLKKVFICWKIGQPIILMCLTDRVQIQSVPASFSYECRLLRESKVQSKAETD